MPRYFVWRWMTKVDFSGRKSGAPLEAFAEELLSEFSAALTARDGSGGLGGKMVSEMVSEEGDDKEGRSCSG